MERRRCSGFGCVSRLLRWGLWGYTANVVIWYSTPINTSIEDVVLRSKIFFFFWQAFEESKGKFQQRFGKNYCGHLTINHYEEERDVGRGGKWVPIFSRTFKYEFISFNFQFFYLVVNALILGSQFLTFYWFFFIFTSCYPSL